MTLISTYWAGNNIADALDMSPALSVLGVVEVAE